MSSHGGCVNDPSETEQINKYNRRAKIILIIGLVFAAIWITLGFALNMAILGVNLS